VFCTSDTRKQIRQHSSTRGVDADARAPDHLVIRFPFAMATLASLASTAEVAALRSRRRAPISSRVFGGRHVSSARRPAFVSADAAVTSGKAVWLTEDGRKETAAGAFTQSFLFDLGVPQFPMNNPAPVNDVAFDSGSEAIAVTINRPLGIVFEEKLDGVYAKIVVDEIVPGSNAERNGNVRVGDVLRMTTAVFNVPGVVDVTAWLNPPKSTNCKAFFNCDQKSFEKVMAAIQSHVVPVDTPAGPMEIGEVGLVLERPAGRK
jgi:hypothetical protein